VPWGSAEPGRAHRDHAAPWPGRLPAPSPAAIPSRALAVALLDGDGARVSVSSGGLLSATPTRLEFDKGQSRIVAGHCGPWPMAERWWGVSRRRAHLQVLLDDGLAVLLRAERSRWWLSGIYD
jgi:protein ImuB